MKVENILVITFILTLLSGFTNMYAPWVLDAIIVYSGFPFHWLMASRGFFGYPPGPLHLAILWNWFVVDFAIYGLLAATAIGVYEKTLRHVNKPAIYRFLFKLSYVFLVICCWAIIWTSSWGQSLFGYPNWLREIYPNIVGWLRFLLGATTIIATWFLIKHFKEFYKTIDSLISLNTNIKQDEVDCHR